ncbi:glycerate kinase [Klebsiella pneumoniae]|uniref:Glycerate kinase n=1 Tax=Klebsiella pneumoniae TaxID=573 RepID=A0A2X3CQ97_KLEPN|nr:glycerate kinase [Klebsiella pneumoniae]
MAAASGLESVPPAQRNPLLTTSWGTGELIRHALDAGVRQIIIGIGGSATNDGGAGMAQALGAKLLTAEGQQIASGGGALETLALIDLSELDSRLADCRIDVACDVTNPLTGPQGASAVFGPQKRGDGADDRPARQRPAALCPDYRPRFRYRRAEP